MGTLTIRNVDDDVNRILRRRVAEHGVSMEQEIRTILRAATRPDEPQRGGWRLKASKEEILALGQEPERPFDQKQVSDEPYAYLDEQL
jgi:plasmid stability protein